MEQAFILIKKLIDLKKMPDDISKLREGFTTGACSAAAARAAALVLVKNVIIEKIKTRLPIGREVIFELKRCERYEDYAICSIIKDAGDDPDCTDKGRIDS